MAALRQTFTCLLGLLLIAPATPAAAQTQFELLKVLQPTLPEGYHPSGPLVQDDDGWIYGLTGGYGDPAAGSNSQYTSVFRFHPGDATGTYETIVNMWQFSVDNSANWRDSQDGGLVEAPDGNFYFTTTGSCQSGVFRVTPPRAITTRVNFGCGTGPLISASNGLTVGPDGALYGIGYRTGSGLAAVYRVGLDDSLSIVVDLPPEFGTQWSYTAYTPLTAGSDGKLYAARTDSRSFVFSVDPVAHTADVVFEFRNEGPCCELRPDGHFPQGRLLEVPPNEDHDLAFLGITTYGGAFGRGVIYRLDVATGSNPASFSKVFDFNATGVFRGTYPRAGLTQTADGIIYGTTRESAGHVGAYGTEYGTVFRIGVDGSPTLVYGYTLQPYAPLLLGADGNLYGSSFTDANGSPGSVWGSFFRLSRPAQAPLSVDAPNAATFGTSFSVYASGGSGTGAVSFAASGACTNVAGGDLITMTSGTGGCTITATKAGDAAYSATTSPPAVVAALKAEQTIGFGPLPDRTMGDTPFAVAATGGASGNPVTFTTTTAAVCTSSGTYGETITLVGTGTCTVRASQAGDVNYDAATDVGQSFLVQGGTTFAGLFDPWSPPGPGTYNGITFTSGRVYKMNSVLPVVWGYSMNGTLVDSSRPTSAEYPVVNVYGPLSDCGGLDGTGTDDVISYSGPGSAVTTYDPVSKTWQRHVKLDSSFKADACYVIRIYDPVAATTSPSFPFKTRK